LPEIQAFKVWSLAMGPWLWLGMCESFINMHMLAGRVVVGVVVANKRKTFFYLKNKQLPEQLPEQLPG
jgi:hypothetical protein